MAINELNTEILCMHEYEIIIHFLTNKNQTS